MNSTSPRQSVILGLFIAVGGAIVVMALFAIGGIREGLQRRIPVTTVFAEVNGLKPGDAVWFAGVPVGTVKGVTFLGNGVEVDLRIEEKSTEWIPSDVLARIGSDSLIGNKLVVLYEGTEGARTLQAGDELRAGTSITPEQIMAQFQLSNDNLLVITNNLKTVSTRLVSEEGSISKLLSDEQLYGQVTASVDGLKQASQAAVVITQDVARLTAELDRPGNLPYDLVHDTKIHASLVASAASLEGMAAGLEKDMTDPGTPVGVLLHDQEAGADLGSTLANLDEGTQLLTENMEALQHNFLLRGYFKKQERKAAREAEAQAEGGGATR